MPFSSVDPSVSVGFLLTSFDQLSVLEDFFDQHTSHLAYSITVEESGQSGVISNKPLSADLDDWVAL
jgi:hypothetical protein